MREKKRGPQEGLQRRGQLIELCAAPVDVDVTKSEYKISRDLVNKLPAIMKKESQEILSNAGPKPLCSDFVDSASRMGL